MEASYVERKRYHGLAVSKHFDGWPTDLEHVLAGVPHRLGLGPRTSAKAVRDLIGTDERFTAVDDRPKTPFNGFYMDRTTALAREPWPYQPDCSWEGE